MSAERAWAVIEAYSRSQVHIFSVVRDERQDGDTRVVTLHDGTEIAEVCVSTDSAAMRHAYTVAGLGGATHHHAVMQVRNGPNGRAVFSWATDALPHQWVDDAKRAGYRGMFEELLAAFERE